MVPVPGSELASLLPLPGAWLKAAVAPCDSRRLWGVCVPCGQWLGHPGSLSPHHDPAAPRSSQCVSQE